MKRMGILAFWLIIVITTVISQHRGAYPLLKSHGELPADFRMSFHEKLKLAAERDSSIGEDEIAFLEETNFYIHQLLQSGKVVFNDPVSKYVEDVADKLLAHQPEIRQQLRFYAVKSPIFNAFATHQGIILINVGLIAQLENEAQLAFILSHEISHFLEKHGLRIYLNSRNFEDEVFRQNGKAEPYEKLLLENSRYSEALEIEADEKGWELYRGSPYAKAAVFECFDLLIHADEPFGQWKSDPDFMDLSFLTVMPKDDSTLAGWDQIEDLPKEEAVVDVVNARRRSRIEALLDTSSSSGKDYWLLEQERFYDVQRICRMESCHLLLARREYEKAIYCAHSMKSTEDDHYFLDKLIAQGLYGIGVYKLNGRFWEVHESYEWADPKLRKLNYFFEFIEPEDLHRIAIYQNWQLSKKYRQDYELLMMLDHLTYMWLQTGKAVEFPWMLPFRDGSTASDVLSRQDSIILELQEGDRTQKEFNTLQEKEKKKRQNKSLRYQQKLLEKGLNLGLSKVVFVDPMYYRVDDRSEQPIQFGPTTQHGEKLNLLLERHSDKVGLQQTILNPRSFSIKDVDGFNDLILLQNWFEEKAKHPDISMVSIYHDDVQPILEKYQTNTFVWLIGGNMSRRRENKGLIMGAGVLLPVLLPYAIYYQATPYRYTFLFAVVYDLKKDEELGRFPMKVKLNDRWDVLNSIVFDFVFQLKN